MSTRPEAIEVYLDAAELGPCARVGRLHHRRGRGQSLLSFEYDLHWLRSGRAFDLDPRLALFGGEQFPAAGHNNFGIFLDSAPDRWGRLLLDRREALLARESKRQPQSLGDWDYLLGVEDSGRMGALRFRRDESGPWLAHSALPVPPAMRLAELATVSLAIEQDRAEDMPAYREWLMALLAPGTSLGGARPKANFVEADGSLWIAKFPSREDRRDIGAWEAVLYQLATECGITTAAHALHRYNSPYHSFCVQRFDRTPQGRRCFVSAMTLLERRDGEGGSYLEIAEFIQNHGARDQIAPDLEQLFRRVLFNVLVGNSDDHLRNHGFIREPRGWRLAPAYDLNPNPARRHHALRLDDVSDLPNVEVVMETAPYYRLKPAAAKKIEKKIRSVVAGWRQRALQTGLSAGECEVMAAAFEGAE